MLVTETVYLSNKEFIHNYSDDGHYIIRNDGVEFADAYDLPTSGYTYTESEKLIPVEPEKEDDTDIVA